MIDDESEGDDDSHGDDDNHDDDDGSSSDGECNIFSSISILLFSFHIKWYQGSCW